MQKQIQWMAIFALMSMAAPILVQAQPPNVVWTRVYGGGNFDKAHCVQQTEDLGFIIVGETYSFGAGESDVYLIKTDSLGIIEWTHTYGGTGEDVGYYVEQTTDYGYIIVGKYNNADPYLIKTDAFGYVSWSQIYTGPFTAGNCVHQTDDNGYIIVGNKYSGTYQDIFLLKTDGLGQEQWSQSFGGSASEYGQCVQRTSDGGYAVFGSTASYGQGYRDMYLIKTDAVGLTLWTGTYGGTGAEFCYSGLQTLDGGYFLGGYNTDIVLVKTNAVGQQEWLQTFGSSTYQDFCIDVRQTWDGNYIMSGQTNIAGNTQAYIVKTNHLGNITWELTVGNANAESAQSIRQIHDGGYIIAGWYGGPWTWDVYLIRLAPDAGSGLIEKGVDNPPSGFTLHPPCPNPFNAATVLSYKLQAPSQVSLKVYDTAGRFVATLVDGWREAGTHEVTFDGSKLASGIYIAKLHTGEYSAVQKLVLLK